MLFLPLLDHGWHPPVFPSRPANLITSACLTFTAIALLVWQPQAIQYTLSTLVLAALPEEWFFRAYLMTRIGDRWRANLSASLLFSVMHGLTQNWATAAMVLAPSLFYGWLYQRSRDLPLLVLAHALSNLVFMLFFAQAIATWLGYLS